MDGRWGDEEGDERFKLDTQGLEDEEAFLLAKQLAEFDMAVHGEVELPKHKAVGRNPSREKPQRMQSDRQTTRPLTVQVDEWSAAFLHLRIKGAACRGVTSQEHGWQWHEARQAEPSQPDPGLKAPSDKPVWRTGGPDTATVFKMATKIANLRHSVDNQGLKGRRASRAARLSDGASEVSLAAEKNKPAPQGKDRPPGARGVKKGVGGGARSVHKGQQDSPGHDLLEGDSKRPEPKMYVRGLRAQILSPAEAGSDHDPEELIGQHGEFEEVLAQHTDNWAVMDTTDMFSNSRRIRMQRALGKEHRARQESEKEREREAARDQELGLPPKEPAACAQAEATAILFDNIWASVSPILAPLLAEMHNSNADMLHEPTSAGMTLESNVFEADNCQADEGSARTEELDSAQLAYPEDEGDTRPQDDTSEALSGSSIFLTGGTEPLWNPTGSPEPIALLSAGVSAAGSISRRRQSADDATMQFQRRLSGNTLLPVQFGVRGSPDTFIFMGSYDSQQTRSSSPNAASTCSTRNTSPEESFSPTQRATCDSRAKLTGSLHGGEPMSAMSRQNSSYNSTQGSMQGLPPTGYSAVSADNFSNAPSRLASPVDSASPGHPALNASHRRLSNSSPATPSCRGTFKDGMLSHYPSTSSNSTHPRLHRLSLGAPPVLSSGQGSALPAISGARLGTPNGTLRQSLAAHYASQHVVLPVITMPGRRG